MESRWSELPDGVRESILKWLPSESVARLRAVSKEWNNILSAQQFLTWRRETLKEDTWLLLQAGESHYYRLNVTTRELKRFFPHNPHGCILASLGGLVVRSGRKYTERFLDNPLNGNGTQFLPLKHTVWVTIVVCNRVSGAFVQLPRLLQMNKELGLRVGDLLWKGYQYQVVAVQNAAIEVYDFSNKSWVVQKQPKRWISDVAFFKGLFFCVVSDDRGCGIMVFSIKEDCTCHVVHHFSPIPSSSPSQGVPYLLVCGSALVSYWRDSREELELWELEDDSDLDLTSKPSWKAIPKMPQELLRVLNSVPKMSQELSLEDLNSDLYFRQFKFESIAAGKYICCFRDCSGNIVFFNTENKSWSCFSLDDKVENCIGPIYVSVFEPRLDISFQ